MARATSELDSLHHTQKMKQRLSETGDHLRDDVDKVDELKAMFEAAIEVLTASRRRSVTGLA